MYQNYPYFVFDFFLLKSSKKINLIYFQVKNNLKNTLNKKNTHQVYDIIKKMSTFFKFRQRGLNLLIVKLRGNMIVDHSNHKIQVFCIDIKDDKPFQ